MDSATTGYYLVEWTSEPYTLQEDTELTEYEPPIRLKAGELVVEAEYFEIVPRTKLWYTRMPGPNNRTTVRVNFVVAADLSLSSISSSNKLPSHLSRKAKEEARNLGAQRVSSEEHDEMLEEIHYRETIEFEDDEEEDSDEDEESEGEEDEEDDEAEQGGEEEVEEE